MMKRAKCLIIFGTRPEAIKLAPVIFEMKRRLERFKVRTIITAQHREMLDQILRYFEIHPDIDLNVMREDQSLAGLTSNMLQELDRVIRSERPDLVIVQGDTTTTFTASLAAFYNHVPVAHIEAGMRTFDKYQPFPEEINRNLTTTLASIHFAPTENNRQNLLANGVPTDAVHVTGNTVIDALFWSLDKNRRCGVRSPFHFPPGQKVILVTAHRRESFGQPLKDICLALRDLVQARENLEIVFPVHLNPNVRKVVHPELGNLPRVHLIDPQSYQIFVEMMSNSFLILTDSGGIQEEAPSLGKPVLVMRELTERSEGLEAGTVKLVGTQRHKIVEEVSKLLTDRIYYEVMTRAHNPYGDGKTSSRIVKHCCDFLGVRNKR